MSTSSEEARVEGAPAFDEEEEWRSYCDKYGYELDSVAGFADEPETSSFSQGEGEEFISSQETDEKEEGRRKSRFETPEEVLQYYWGYSEFRPKQREIIDSILAGRDTLGLLPTGGGKSITFQVPGLMMRGVTLVVTPLIALMRDQVEHLKERKISAVAIHSGMASFEIQRTLDNAILGAYKFLYLSPERIASPLFRSILPQLKVSMIVVDECHCISQWGYDFRPSYMRVAELRSWLPKAPVLALTATATKLVAEDVMRVLHFPEPNIIQRSFLRPNVAYVVRHTGDKAATMLRILSGVPGTSIVYCRNRKRTEELAEYLRGEGITADAFHAGLTHAERNERQRRWMAGEVRVMVATNAFGMGIDKSDVRSVIHWMLPSSPEEYFQEAGRAGRDGEKSFAVALVDKRDPMLVRRRISEEFPPRQFLSEVYDQLTSFLGIGMGEGYLRTFLVDIERFIKLNKLPPIYTMSAIRLLDTAGVWEYRDKEDQHSRLLFTIDREALYNNASLSPASDSLIQFLLRRYTGIFTEYVFIEEDTIARALNCTVETIYLMLVDLSRSNIVHYIPRSSLPKLFLLTRREEGRHLLVSREVYEVRRERLAERIEAMIAYASASDTCRSQLLLRYFGEEESEPCGMCDVCLSHRKGSPTSSISLSEAVALLQKESEALIPKEGLLPLVSWREQSRVPSSLFFEALQQLLARGRVILDGDSCRIA